MKPQRHLGEAYHHRGGSMGMNDGADQYSWNSTKTMELICLYRSNQLLWDYHHADYTNNRKRFQVFQDMAETLGNDVTVNAIKAKLKSLRTQFARNVHQMSAIRERQSAQGLAVDDESAYTRPWQYFEPLRFLLDVLGSGEGGSGGPGAKRSAHGLPDTYFTGSHAMGLVSNSTDSGDSGAASGQIDAFLLDELSTDSTSNPDNGDDDLDAHTRHHQPISVEGITDGQSNHPDGIKQEEITFEEAAASEDHGRGPPPVKRRKPGEDQFDLFANYVAATLRSTHESNQSNAMLNIQQILIHYSMSTPNAPPPCGLATMPPPNS